LVRFNDEIYWEEQVRRKVWEGAIDCLLQGYGPRELKAGNSIAWNALAKFEPKKIAIEAERKLGRVRRGGEIVEVDFVIESPVCRMSGSVRVCVD
jgi:hypothetical protein